MNPFIWLLTTVISLYTFAILVWIILGLLINFNIVNRSHPFVYRVEDFLSRLIEPALKPIRKYIPPIGGIDISPIILLLALHFIENAVMYYFYRF